MYLVSSQLLIENSEKKADTSAQLTQQFQERDVFPSGSSSSMLPTKSAEEEAPPPNDLLCPICKQIYTDAVITPCCHNSFCDHCNETKIEEIFHLTVMFIFYSKVYAQL